MSGLSADSSAGASEGSSGGASEAPGPARPELVDALLAWYRERERDGVPWRGERDPYRIWVGEVMAQQTRMETVRERYDAFLERFPDVDSLAAAELGAVLKAWEGLGYYARARRLHRAARRVLDHHEGRVPEEVEALRSLPGVGPYTAGAVASLAFGLSEPAVDGNAERVLSRLLDAASPSRRELEDVARRLLRLRPGEPAALNQALMDLGAEICRPRRPACPRCPLAPGCLARARGTAERRPAPARGRKIPHRDVAVGIVRDPHRRLLIQRRPPSGLLGGLWEFPGGKVEAGEDPPAAVRRELREELDIEVRPGPLVARVEHAYSHFRITLYAHEAAWLSGEPSPRSATAWAWVAAEELADYAFPAANARVIEALGEPASP